MNEDETYKKLMRIPYREMLPKYMDWSLSTMVAHDNETSEQFCVKFGWTYEELREECDREIITNEFRRPSSRSF